MQLSSLNVHLFLVGHLFDDQGIGRGAVLLN